MIVQLEKRKKKLSPKHDKTVMFCECCEKPFKRWDLDMVEPEDSVFDVNKLLKDRGEIVESNFACPECVTELVLQPLQTEEAKKFRRINEGLRQELEPQIVN